MSVRIQDHIILGAEIRATIARGIRIAHDIGERVSFRFNGVEVEVLGPSDPDLIYRDWDRAMRGYIDRKVGPAPAPLLSEAEIAGDAAVEAQNVERRAKAGAEHAEREKRGKAELAAALAKALAFTCDEVRWAEAVAAQGDSSYGLATLDFAAVWARLMQASMAEGAKLPDIADEACTLADRGYGITGFMFGCAVAVLAETWAYGPELRRWHNAKHGVTDDRPGTVNPAILTVQPSKSA